MSELSYQDSIHVDCDPETLYDLVSDVTRMGEWSPICAACWWDDDRDGDSGPRPGAWFTGRNETPDRTWQTRSQVVVADRGREFAFEVNNGWVRWGYLFAPAGSGTELTETWNFLPAGIAGFHGRYGPDAETQIAERTSAAHRGIPLTLAAIKKTAEAA